MSTITEKLSVIKAEKTELKKILKEMYPDKEYTFVELSTGFNTAKTERSEFKEQRDVISGAYDDLSASYDEISAECGIISAKYDTLSAQYDTLSAKNIEYDNAITKISSDVSAILPEDSQISDLPVVVKLMKNEISSTSCLVDDILT